MAVTTIRVFRCDADECKTTRSVAAPVLHPNGWCSLSVARTPDGNARTEIDLCPRHSDQVTALFGQVQADIDDAAPVSFGAWLHEQMRLKNIRSRRVMAERLGVSTHLVDKWVSNRGRPIQPEHFDGLEQALGIDALEIARIAGRIPARRLMEIA